MSEEIVIYSSGTCGWAVRNYAALFEKGVAFELVNVKTSPEARNEFEGLFPYGLTPGFRHGDTLIWESLLINDYIEDQFAGVSLLPGTPSARARARQWLYHCDGVLFPLLYKAMRDESAQASLQSALDKLSSPAFLKEAPAPYWNGEQIGLVDFAYHVLFKSLRVAAFKYIALPAWAQVWSEAVAEAPSVRKAEAFMASLRDTNAA